MVKRILATMTLACAAALAHGAPAPMGYDDARHLLARTGFGPTDAEVRRFAGLTREQAVTALLRDTRTQAVTAPPAWALDGGPLRAPRGESATEEERRAFRQQQRPRGHRAARVVGAGDARDAVAAHRADDAVLAQPLRVEPAEGALRAAHVRAERDAARARARQLRDAAARGVEGAGDARLPRRRAEPARPAQRELRARGDGALHAGRRAVHRSRTSRRRRARSPAGASTARPGTYLFRRGLHDPGVKTVLGRTGRFDGDAVLDVILARPQTSEYIIAKLWREFVSAASPKPPR